MKIILTGSLGNIGQPLAKELLQKNNHVTVISNDPNKQKDIEALGATAAIGTIEDVNFLTRAFTGADAVYCMLPPFDFVKNPKIDMREEARRIAGNYAEAIRRSGVKRVVYLSSVGADMATGSGLINFHNVAEGILNQLPDDVTLRYVRAGSIYYNLLSFTGMIRTQGKILSNYGGDDIVPWVSPADIAAAVTEDITSPETGRHIRYAVSDELSCNEVARILGEAIGKPGLQWGLISDQQMLDILKQFGTPEQVAEGITEMNASTHSGLLFRDYYQHKPAEMGKVKMKDFAKDFAAVYNAGK